MSANLLAATAATAPGLVFNVGNGTRTTLNELLALIAKESAGCRARGHEAARVGDVRHSQADIALARKHLGYEPAVGLEEGLRAHDRVRSARARGRPSRRSVDEGRHPRRRPRHAALTR